MDHATHTRLRDDEISEAIVTGAMVYGPDDEEIGTVEHLHLSGHETAVVIATGGQLVTGDNTVAISLLDLTFMRDPNRKVHAVTSWTRDELLHRRHG